MPRAAPPATADDGSSTAAAPEPSMTSVSTTTVTDPSSVNTESAGVEDAESSQGGKPTQLESGNDLTAAEEALLGQSPAGRSGAAAPRDQPAPPPNGDGAPPPAKQGSAGAEGAEIARPTDSASGGPRPSDSLSAMLNKLFGVFIFTIKVP